MWSKKKKPHRIISILGYDFALKGWLCWTRENIGKWNYFSVNHALGAGTITWPVDLQFNELPLCYNCLLDRRRKYMTDVTVSSPRCSCTYSPHPGNDTEPNKVPILRKVDWVSDERWGIYELWIDFSAKFIYTQIYTGFSATSYPSCSICRPKYHPPRVRPDSIISAGGSSHKGSWSIEGVITFDHALWPNFSALHDLVKDYINLYPVCKIFFQYPVPKSRPIIVLFVFRGSTWIQKFTHCISKGTSVVRW